MFQLPQPTKAKLKKVEDKAIKVGQKDLRPAVLVTHETVLPNTALEMFGADLRSTFYGKGSPGAKGRKQAQLEGVDMVEDLPALTDTGAAVSELHWHKEQTGCTLTIDYGAGGERSNITLKDGTLMKRARLQLLEGGAIKITHRFHAPVEHLSAEQLGQLHLMHQRDVKITLHGPTIDDSQQVIGDAGGAEGDDGGGEVVTPPPGGKRGRGGKALTPIQALKKANKAAGESES